MKQTVKQISEGVSFDLSKKIDYNTVEFWKDGNRFIRLHNTTILAFLANGDIVLNTDGWRTVTTKDRLNKYLPRAYRVKQINKIWYLNDTVYADNMIIHANGSFEGAGENPKKTLLLDKRIKNYVSDFVTALDERKLEKPSSGDCWYCSMREVKTEKSLGEVSHSKDHILSHIDEGYYVPSLLVNAIESFPVSPIAMHYVGYSLHMHDEPCNGFADIAKKQVKKSLLRYVRRQLDIAA